MFLRVRLYLIFFRNEKVFVYFDGGNCDWFDFPDIYVDTSCKKPFDSADVVQYNPKVSEDLKISTKFFLTRFVKTCNIKFQVFFIYYYYFFLNFGSFEKL